MQLLILPHAVFFQGDYMGGINENTAVSWRLQAAYIMDQFPLCDYRVPEKEGRYVLDALILGDDYMADAFFCEYHCMCPDA